MPKLKYRQKKKRVCVSISGQHLKIASQIDNFSAFVQLALDNAADIMAWDILKNVDPEIYHGNARMEDVIDQFNALHPQNELTQKRNGTWHKPSAKLPEILS